MSADGGLGRIEDRDAVAENEGHEDCDCRHCLPFDILVDPLSGHESIVVLGHTLSRSHKGHHFSEFPGKGATLSIWKDGDHVSCVLGMSGATGAWCGDGETPADAARAALAAFSDEQASIAKNARSFAALARAAVAAAPSGFHAHLLTPGSKLRRAMGGE